MEASDLPVFRSDLPPGIEPSLDYNNPSSTDHLLREPHPIFAGHLNQLAWSLVTLASYIKYSGFTFTDTSTSTSFSYVTTTETRYTGTATYALSGTCIPKIATLCWFRHIRWQFFTQNLWWTIHFCYYKCYIPKKIHWHFFPMHKSYFMRVCVWHNFTLYTFTLKWDLFIF